MPPISLGVAGAYLVLQIGNKSYTLKSEPIDLLPDESTTIPKSIRYHYKDYENPIDVGTIDQLLQELQELLSTTAMTEADTLMTQWTTLRKKLVNMPIIGSAVTTAERTDVQIVEIGLELKRDQPQAGQFTGAFQLGVMFVPEVFPRFRNITVRRFGTVLTVGLTGSLAQLSELAQ